MNGNGGAGRMELLLFIGSHILGHRVVSHRINWYTSPYCFFSLVRFVSEA